VSAELLNQLSSKSEASSPLEKIKPKMNISLSPIQPKNNFFGISSRNSAFNSFQTPCITPRFSVQNEQANTTIKTESIINESFGIKTKTNQKSLFEAFNVSNTPSCDYLKLFSSLIQPNKK